MNKQITLTFGFDIHKKEWYLCPYLGLLLVSSHQLVLSWLCFSVYVEW